MVLAEGRGFASCKRGSRLLDDLLGGGAGGGGGVREGVFGASGGAEGGAGSEIGFELPFSLSVIPWALKTSRAASTRSTKSL
jgi:hypothetical protein